MWDVAIVGGRIAGMATAARLQARGLSTIVLESHRQAGGCAGYYCRRGFSFDVGATTLVDFEREGVGGQLLEEIGMQPVPSESLPGYVAWLPDRQVALFRDRPLRERERLRLGDSPGHRKFWSLMDRLAEVFWRASRLGIKLPIRHIADVARIFSAIRLSDLPLARYGRWTLGEALRRYGLRAEKPLVGLLSMLVEDTVHSRVAAEASITMRKIGGRLSMPIGLRAGPRTAGQAGMSAPRGGFGIGALKRTARKGSEMLRRRALWWVFGLLLLTMSGGAAPLRAEDGEQEIVRRIEAARKGCCNILVEGRLAGSGCCIDPQGMGLTAAHLLGAPKGDIEVLFKSGERAPAKIVAVDLTADLALFKLPGREQPYPFLPVAKEAPKVTETVFLIGSPIFRRGLVMRGSVASDGPHYEYAGDHYIVGFHIAGPGPSGSSGGPWLSAAGEVIGVQTSSITIDEVPQGIAVSAPLAAIQQLVAVPRNPRTPALGTAVEELWGQEAEYIQNVAAGTKGLARIIHGRADWVRRLADGCS